MSGYTRKNVGSIVKSKDPTKSNYIKFNLKQLGSPTLTITDGMILSAESKKFQLESLAAAEKAGKLSEDVAAKKRSFIEKIPDFVIADLVLVEKN